MHVMKMLPKVFKYFSYSFLKPRIINIQTVAFSSKSAEIPKNILENYITAHKQPTNGHVYDKKPFRIRLEAGKDYFWCLCGRSKSQPFCDSTHKDVYLKIIHRPVKFQVTETKLYWLCQCKHSAHRPFCDGSHKSKIVQDAASTIRQ